MEQRKVLVIDDSKVARKLLAKLLIEREISVDEADSGESGLIRLRECPPDAVFLDLAMPGIDGMETLSRLHADPAIPTLPVVICSAENIAAQRSQEFGEGVVGVLGKPYTAIELETLLDKIYTPQNIAVKPTSHAAVETKLTETVIPTSDVSETAALLPLAASDPAILLKLDQLNEQIASLTRQLSQRDLALAEVQAPTPAPSAMMLTSEQIEQLAQALALRIGATASLTDLNPISASADSQRQPISTRHRPTHRKNLLSWWPLSKMSK